jgi:hypothetical protein
MTYGESARTTTRRIPGTLAGGLLVVAAIAAVPCHQLLTSSFSTAPPPTDMLPGEHHSALGKALPSTAWPEDGQAAVQIGQSQIQAGPNQHPAPIASVAKVMTVYLVLRDHVVGVLAGAAATAMYANSKGWAVVIPAEAWSGGIASAILIGAFAGLMPAVRASRLPPSVALRTV